MSPSLLTLLPHSWRRLVRRTCATALRVCKCACCRAAVMCWGYGLAVADGCCCCCCRRVADDLLQLQCRVHLLLTCHSVLRPRSTVQRSCRCSCPTANVLKTTRVCGCCKLPLVRILLLWSQGRGAAYHAPHDASMFLADACPFASASRNNRTASAASFSTPFP